MKIQFPIDPNTDYRLPENRLYFVKAWAEAMYSTGELDQQLRLMNHATDDIESKLWLAFLWGCCYNFTGPFVIMSEFPVPPTKKGMQGFADWYNKNFERIRVDTDCRYRKSKMIECVQSYVDWLDGSTQKSALVDSYLDTTMWSNEEMYTQLHQICNSWKYFGRLSCWNYLEALALVTEHKTFDCPDFLLHEIEDSESNRNGVAFVISREDLVTKHGKKKSNGEKISTQELELLSFEGERIFQEIKTDFKEFSVKRFNVETIFCWTKKRFRPRSSRYFGWDDERTIDEIGFVSTHWPELNLDKIFVAREHFLPDFLSSVKQGVDKSKMSVFYDAGTPQDLIYFNKGLHWNKTPTQTTTELW